MDREKLVEEMRMAARKAYMEAADFSTGDPLDIGMSAALAVAEAAIREDERERCAKVAEHGHCTASGCDPKTTGHSDLCPIGIAAAIRARGDQR